MCLNIPLEISICEKKALATAAGFLKGGSLLIDSTDLLCYTVLPGTEFEDQGESLDNPRDSMHFRPPGLHPGSCAVCTSTSVSLGSGSWCDSRIQGGNSP